MVLVGVWASEKVQFPRGIETMEMNFDFEQLVHPRLVTHCRQLILDRHYKHAVLEAMTQVELALKEKSGVRDKYGVNLCTSLFGEGKGIKLRVPFGDEMQAKAESLFLAAFSYYRNYAAHDGREIDHRTALRILVLASELLDLIGASAVCFADIGGTRGLIKSRVFASEASVCELLQFLDGYIVVDMVVDGLYEELASRGFGDRHVQALVEIGLIEYIEKPYVPTADEMLDRVAPPDTVGSFGLTAMGRKISGSAG